MADGIRSYLMAERQAADGIRSYLEDAVAKMNGYPTMAERQAQDNLNRYLEKKQDYREFQKNNLPMELTQFDPYTLPENFRLNPDVGPVSPYEYTNLTEKIYRHANNPKYATPSGLETMPARDYNPSSRADFMHPPLMSLSGAYALPRAMASAKELGIPQLPPELLGGLYLQEGRTDMGSNTYDTNNKGLNALVNTLTDKYGVDYKTASFLATVKEKQDIADRLKIPFGEAWNGTGRVGTSKRTGKTYANELQGQIKASQMPENKKLMDMINLGLEHGRQYPLVDLKAMEAYYRDNPSTRDKAGISSLLPTGQ